MFGGSATGYESEIEHWPTLSVNVNVRAEKGNCFVPDVLRLFDFNNLCVFFIDFTKSQQCQNSI